LRPFSTIPGCEALSAFCHEQPISQLITTWLETFIFSSDGVPREPPKKHSDFWDLIFYLLWAEMTYHHLNNDLFDHERRQPSAALGAMIPTKKFLKDLPL
jgi:hypothetical protein